MHVCFYCCRGVPWLIPRGFMQQTARSRSTSTKYTRKWKHNLHVYNYSFNWDSTNALSNFLARNIILNQNGLVVINKPFGVGKQEPVANERKLKVENRLRTASVGNRNFYLQDILPLLATKLGYEHLETVKIPERYTSGITILSSSEELSLHVKECIRKGRARGCFLDTYWIVSVYRPEPLFFKGKFAIEHEEDKFAGDSQPVLRTTWSSNAVKRGDVKVVSVEHETLCEGQLASLVQVKPSQSKSHFLRLYMADMLSPVLGDNLYGSRVQTVRGVPLQISPFSDKAKALKRLDDRLLSALDLQRQDESFIPAHIHLREVIIPDFIGKGQSLCVEAPLPEPFDWTCKQLHLQAPPEDKVKKLTI